MGEGWMAFLGGRAGAGCMGVPQASLLRAWPVNLARSLSVMGLSAATPHLPVRVCIFPGALRALM